MKIIDIALFRSVLYVTARTGEQQISNRTIKNFRRIEWWVIASVKRCQETKQSKTIKWFIRSTVINVWAYSSLGFLRRDDHKRESVKRSPYLGPPSSMRPACCHILGITFTKATLPLGLVFSFYSQHCCPIYFDLIDTELFDWLWSQIPLKDRKGNNLLLLLPMQAVPREGK